MVPVAASSAADAGAVVLQADRTAALPAMAPAGRASPRKTAIALCGTSDQNRLWPMSPKVW